MEAGGQAGLCMCVSGEWMEGELRNWALGLERKCKQSLRWKAG